MANPLAALSAANDIAALSGLFNWAMVDGSYTNPDGATVSFHIIDNQQVPIEEYVQGAINTFNLVNGPSATDPNKGLFNTISVADGLRETITRKYALNRIPLANYDQPVDLGVGAQRITFNVVFFGTMYQTAYFNIVQNLFNNSVTGLGTLTHPFYNKIKNVLPIELSTTYRYDSLNCAICEITFLTSDISHLNPATISESITQSISKYYIGIQNSITSIAGTITAAESGISNTSAGLGL